MLKKIGIVLFVLILAVGGVEYGKHRILLSKLIEICHEHEINMENPRISFDDSGFHVMSDNLKGKDLTVESVKARMPFFDFSRFRFRANAIFAYGTKVRRFYAIVETEGQRIDVEYYTFKDFNFLMMGREFLVPDVSGTLTYKPTRMEYTLYGDSVQHGGQNLFTLASHGSITNPSSPDKRVGRVNLRVSHIKNFLGVLEKSGILPSWQGALFGNTLGDNKQVPFVIRGKKVFFGPVKLFEVDF